MRFSTITVSALSMGSVLALPATADATSDALIVPEAVTWAGEFVNGEFVQEVETDVVEDDALEKRAAVTAAILSTAGTAAVTMLTERAINAAIGFIGNLSNWNRAREEFTKKTTAEMWARNPDRRKFPGVVCYNKGYGVANSRNIDGKISAQLRLGVLNTDYDCMYIAAPNQFWTHGDGGYINSEHSKTLRNVLTAFMNSDNESVLHEVTTRDLAVIIFINDLVAESSGFQFLWAKTELWNRLPTEWGVAGSTFSYMMQTRSVMDVDAIPRSLTLAAICDAFHWRSTSRQEDESVAISSLIGQSSEVILEARRSDWVKILLQSIGKIPLALTVFSGDRMKDEGWRWAPKSLLRLRKHDDSNALRQRYSRMLRINLNIPSSFVNDAQLAEVTTTGALLV
ncbi:hypothetical protein HJFPF1_02609 [Paramyrothecium foliicola]|nr:hypothetical protein HJFPF1_02609 [Paramyrothecium foliicola]